MTVRGASAAPAAGTNFITAASSRFSTRVVVAPKIRPFAAAYASKLPCQSRWSCVMLRIAAASGAKVRAVSSWKLDSSSTQTSGSAVASIAAASRSSIAGLMLPATPTFLPARSHNKPVRLVVVVLPLVPVIASTFG